MEQSQEALCFPRYKGLGARKGPEGAPGATAHPLCLPLKVTSSPVLYSA